MVIIPEISAIPEDFCFTTVQEFAPPFVALMTVTVPDNPGFNYGFYSGDVPAAADQGKPWIRLNADGRFDKVYAFVNGKWSSPHPIQQGATSDILQLYDGDATALDTYDGASAGAITVNTGPMWEIVSAWVDRVPRGVGVLALNTNAATFDVGTPALEARGVNFIRRTVRQDYTFPV